MSDQETVRMPLWKTLAEKMAEGGLSYGQRWPIEFFEQGLREVRDSHAFSFAMLNLRAFIEKEEGYYLASIENGLAFGIPSAPSHEDVAATMDKKVRTYAVRSINLRAATLANPSAELTDVERSKMEKNLEHASVRLVLMSRAKSFADLAKKHEPKLLVKG